MSPHLPQSKPSAFPESPNSHWGPYLPVAGQEAVCAAW